MINLSSSPSWTRSILITASYCSPARPSIIAKVEAGEETEDDEKTQMEH